MQPSATTMFSPETAVELVDKPGSSFQWAPRAEYTHPNLHGFIEEHVVIQGVPVVISNANKGKISNIDENSLTLWV